MGNRTLEAKTKIEVAKDSKDAKDWQEIARFLSNDAL